MDHQLQEIFKRLSEQDRASVLAFAEFLLQRSPQPVKPVVIEEPKHVERPQEESVIKAVKRLSAVYFMVDRGDMLNETSNLVTGHMTQGRPAPEVIDDLEALFAEHYQRYVDRMNAD